MLASYKCKAAAIVVLTTSGTTSHIVSKYKPHCPILSVTRYVQICFFLSPKRTSMMISYAKVWSSGTTDADLQRVHPIAVWEGARCWLDEGRRRPGPVCHRLWQAEQLHRDWRQRCRHHWMAEGIRVFKHRQDPVSHRRILLLQYKFESRNTNFIKGPICVMMMCICFIKHLHNQQSKPPMVVSFDPGCNVSVQTNTMASHKLRVVSTTRWTL